MSGEEILELFDEVGDILSALQSELSYLRTSDTGNDPTDHIRHDLDRFHEKILTAIVKERTAAARPLANSAPVVEPNKKGV